jgi:hypothetical protein
LSFGKAKLTFSNLKTPLKVDGITALTSFFIKGTRSIMLKILDAANFPSPIFFKEGDNWLRFKAGRRRQKKMVATLPPAYLLS